MVSLSAAQSLKKLVLCKNPCCKTSIDALYFHYVVANLEHLENLDGTSNHVNEKKGIDYISSPLGQNLVQQMAQRGRASEATILMEEDLDLSQNLQDGKFIEYYTE